MLSKYQVHNCMVKKWIFITRDSPGTTSANHVYYSLGNQIGQCYLLDQMLLYSPRDVALIPCKTLPVSKYSRLNENLDTDYAWFKGSLNAVICK